MKAGDLLHITRAASVQFVNPMWFRLVKVLAERHPYDGWIWLDGYQLNDRGDAVARREIFVQTAGLRKLTTPPPAPRRAAAGRTNQAAHRHRQAEVPRKPSAISGKPTLP
ncbi:hypothetical protein ACH47V_23760 [Micromonospora chersina]|uniref:hypothetical protein n=1 Tax=Micromonospora chersina TaxID=47854 RepID=UPI0037BA327F